MWREREHGQWWSRPGRGTIERVGVTAHRALQIAGSVAAIMLGPLNVAAAEPAAPACRPQSPTPPPPAKPKPWVGRGHPPVVIATGPQMGPHAFGNSECRAEEAECQTRGTFFGLGWGVELRARIFELLYGHVRPWVVGNVSKRGPVYRGAVGGGVGLGVYGQHAFVRGEYIALHAFGEHTFEPPFYEGEVASETFGNHAGLFSAGFRRQVSPRVGIELWGGPMIGPHAVRRVPGADTERRTLITFMIGFGVSFDVLRDRADR